MTYQTMWQSNGPTSAAQPSNRSDWAGRQNERGSEELAQALGWFSLGLGLAQLAAPGQVARLIGVADNSNVQTVLRTIGLREIASGVGILTQTRPTGWLQARIGGDVLDLALLSKALSSSQAQPGRVALAMAAVAGVTALDVLCSQQLGDQPSVAEQLNRSPSASPYGADGQTVSVAHEQGIHVEKYITINRSAAEIYQFWRNFENLPSFMNHLEAVEVLDEQRSRWQAKAPLGFKVGWEAAIIDDTPNERISWRSLAGADVPNAGSVRFKPATGGRGTVVAVTIEYDPPGGAVGATIAKLFGKEPGQQVQDDLRALKQVMETGEVVRSEGSLRGAPIGQRKAQPPKQKELEKVMQ